MAIGIQFDPDELPALVEAAVRSFDFTLPGKDQSVGRDLAVAAAEGIADRSNQGLDADGQPFKPNAQAYAEYKLQKYSVDRPGELGGQMLSFKSVLGSPKITADRVEMTYGTGEPPQRSISRTGVEMLPEELEPTDVEKADWFFGGGREFFALDDEIAEAVVAVAAEALSEHLDAAGF